MMASTNNLSLLLTGVTDLLEASRTSEAAQRERFNVFSVLRMERRENRTHSAFLGALLHPDGTHGMGHRFLRFFLERTGLADHLELKTTRLRLERDLGPRNDAEGTGGRVDIYFWDKKGHSVCIENKIDAQDQYRQVVRYCSHNPKKNKVLYLSLLGKEPHPDSKACLKAGVHFEVISYQQHILPWLEDCLPVAADSPMLRESIKQYQRLIQKLTMTTDKTQQPALDALLLQHFEEAAYVAANFDRTKHGLLERIREGVIAGLEKTLGPAFRLSKLTDVDKPRANVVARFAHLMEQDLCFGIQSFSGAGNFDGRLFAGIYNSRGKENRFTRERGETPQWWYDERFIEWNGEESVSLGNPRLLATLADAHTRNQFVDTVVQQAADYIREHNDLVHGFGS
ncbi:MAG: hypothetical protein EOO11_05000 [Chitinophagaceae bacterium]|nr:MAG: hypothetical protein EOO11_05000 [Chitinophagaceae bacterium]